MSTDLIETTDEAHDLVPVEHHRIDAAQSRIESVARVIDAAYQRASTLELSETESQKLLAAFPDDSIRTGAKGKEHLLYLEHASVRTRMLEVFGPGRWSLICRRMWTEEYKTAKGATAVRVYADCVLIVRGCYVGETIGAGNYFTNNPEQDYSDAAEAAQSEALRRICGKYLGVGLNLWNKAWTEAWKQRQRGGAKPPQNGTEPKNPEPTKAQPDAAIVAERTAWLAADPSLQDVNDYLPKLKNLTYPTNEVVWGMIKKHAEDAWVFSQAAKKFEFPANATFGADAPIIGSADGSGDPERDPFASL